MLEFYLGVRTSLRPSASKWGNHYPKGSFPEMPCLTNPYIPLQTSSILSTIVSPYSELELSTTILL